MGGENYQLLRKADSNAVFFQPYKLGDDEHLINILGGEDYQQKNDVICWDVFPRMIKKDEIQPPVLTVDGSTSGEIPGSKKLSMNYRMVI